MIITRSPLRISLGGGGTDLPSYYNDHGGFLIAAAIDKYVYITIHKSFSEEVILKYSSFEKSGSVQELKHPIIREALKLLDIHPPIEITSLADIPSGTGLGSSGSFTTALLKALHSYKNNFIHPRDLAEQACHIELDILKEPIGRQDQYIAAFGGITCFYFEKDKPVKAHPLSIAKDTLYALEDNLVLFFTGYSRSASAVLKEQDQKSKSSDKDMLDNLHFVKQLGYESMSAFEKGDLHEFARLMNVHWEHKKKRSAGMSNNHINELYDFAIRNGALGGKLIGAGGGGFLLFYTEDKIRLRKAMQQHGLNEVRFRFDFEGTKILVNS